jgi:hypothetical protein
MGSGQASKQVGSNFQKQSEKQSGTDHDKKTTKRGRTKEAEQKRKKWGAGFKVVKLKTTSPSPQQKEAVTIQKHFIFIHFWS